MRTVPPSLWQDYLACRTATRHYENFNVVSLLVPTGLRPHFWAIYAYCRTVDDLGDEYAGDRMAALADLERELERALTGKATRPYFRALQDTIQRFDLPSSAFFRLIEANRRDQQARGYRTFQEVREYCSYSAEPVGHLVLALFGFRDVERLALSDATTTALQLTNFWQDVERDLDRGRIYLPAEDCERFGVARGMLASRHGSQAVRDLMAFEVERTRALFAQGARLESMVPVRLRLQLRLYRLGGETILDALSAQAFDPFQGRPEVSRRQKLGIVWRALWQRAPVQGSESPAIRR